MLMKNVPHVSIVIPVYNGEKTLRNCLNSVCAQTYGDYEVIVVNNNSKDNTAQIIHHFQTQYSFVRNIFEDKPGRGSARNAGEKASLGNIVLMTDDDCIVPKDWIEKMIKPILYEGVDVVQGFETSLSHDFWSLNCQKFSERKWDRFDGSYYPGYIDTKNLAIKREVLNQIGFSSRIYFSSEDTDLSLRLFIEKAKVKLVRDVAVFHQHPQTLFEVISKHIHRGYWSYVVNHDYRDNPNLKKFRADSAQTFASFFKIKEFVRTLYSEGLRFGVYILITGLSWRLGMISGFLNYRSGKKGFNKR